MSNGAAWVSLVVDSLPADERAVIDRLYYERLSEEATASDLGVTRKKVRGLRRRAFQRMRDALGRLDDATTH
jgi:DNA-directed RNA polymerase specialized sigma24 family protein